MLRAIFDIIVSTIALLVLSPFLILITIAIAFDSRGGVFFKQVRVGKNRKNFNLLKFRTMRPFSEREGKITVGNDDPRITHVGAFLRKYKIDELPQLFNVLLGNMHLVGPRPEVPEYVAKYSTEQLRVLSVKPGITDYASLEYFNENELLGQSSNPEETYVNVVMPAKLKMNLEYVDNRNFPLDLKIMVKTMMRILS